MNPQLSNIIYQNWSTPFKKAIFPSKIEILLWASTILALKIKYIEQLTTGAIFCQLLDANHTPDQFRWIKWTEVPIMKMNIYIILDYYSKV